MECVPGFSCSKPGVFNFSANTIKVQAAIIDFQFRNALNRSDKYWKNIFWWCDLNEALYKSGKWRKRWKVAAQYTAKTENDT
ncbi:hypothetical protein HYD_6130 [Candidatus Hydrogenosomobacter endosymbioticus]|uniref:Uncharacterized protein n=1 Tax=Candidatus Hydrogenosomobacter endosymbioticus TaxID=2558174 RepID=A0ABM7V9L7_9PROT|nr:hypothetical protein HYD_6130 [Candidatus Hydrogenosomobacter endosymbioticus]